MKKSLCCLLLLLLSIHIFSQQCTSILSEMVIGKDVILCRYDIPSISEKYRCETGCFIVTDSLGMASDYIYHCHHDTLDTLCVRRYRLVRDTIRVLYQDSGYLKIQEKITHYDYKRAISIYHYWQNKHIHRISKSHQKKHGVFVERNCMIDIAFIDRNNSIREKYQFAFLLYPLNAPKDIIDFIITNFFLPHLYFDDIYKLYQTVSASADNNKIVNYSNP